MADVVILILFTYPGVFAEYVYHCLAKGKSFPDKVDDVFRVARDFFVSAFVTMIALWAFALSKDMPYVLKLLMDELQTGSNLWEYCCISVVFSMMTGCIWYFLAYGLFALQNIKQYQENGTITSVNEFVWLDFRAVKETELKDGRPILAIYKNGVLVTAGFLSVLTYDPGDDPGITLDSVEIVSSELINSSEYIDTAVSTYYDMNTGTTYSLYDGMALYEKLQSETADEK